MLREQVLRLCGVRDLSHGHRDTPAVRSESALLPHHPAAPARNHRPALAASTVSTAASESLFAPGSIVIRSRASSHSTTIAPAAGFCSGTGERTTYANRTSGVDVPASRPSRDDHHRRVPADQLRPALNALAVLPLALQLATRFFQIAAVFAIGPRSSNFQAEFQGRGPCTGYSSFTRDVSQTR
jgi:hypothetical protein